MVGVVTNGYIRGKVAWGIVRRQVGCCLSDMCVAFLFFSLLKNKKIIQYNSRTSLTGTGSDPGIVMVRTTEE